MKCKYFFEQSNETKQIFNRKILIVALKQSINGKSLVVCSSKGGFDWNLRFNFQLVLLCGIHFQVGAGILKSRQPRKPPKMVMPENRMMDVKLNNQREGARKSQVLLY